MGSRPLIMGILNVTPDSFSDGGCFLDGARAAAHGLEMAEAGAAIVDVGGESTRPGADPVPADEERRRVVPVIRALREGCGALVSVDTMKADVAEAALDAGAHIVNDVSALRHDPRMRDVVRRSGAGAVLMHMQGTPRTMQQDPRYADVVEDVRGFLEQRIEALTAWGVPREALALDPGIGFGKTLDHNVALLSNLGALAGAGRPVVVGLSRKSFLGRLTGRDVTGRLAASLAALSFCVLNGAHVIRVHDVRESVDAVNVLTALRRGRA
jgi:dihydropteroate synthase